VGRLLCGVDGRGLCKRCGLGRLDIGQGLVVEMDIETLEALRCLRAQGLSTMQSKPPRPTYRVSTMSNREYPSLRDSFTVPNLDRVYIY